MPSMIIFTNETFIFKLFRNTNVISDLISLLQMMSCDTVAINVQVRGKHLKKNERGFISLP